MSSRKKARAKKKTKGRSKKAAGAARPKQTSAGKRVAKRSVEKRTSGGRRKPGAATSDAAAPDRSKLDTKLRMVINGSSAVNTLRAEQSSSIGVTDPELLKEVPTLREPTARAKRRDALPRRARRGHLDRATDRVAADVFVQLVEGTEDLPEVLKTLTSARRQDIVTARVPLSRLDEIAADPRVRGLEAGQRIVFSPPLEPSAAPAPARARVTQPVEPVLPVLVGIVDVQGFDFAHPDFRDASGTRFVRIWDQGGTNRPPPEGREFAYGSELCADHLNAAIAAEENFGLPAWQLEPQSQMTPGSHATHVASIAAGNQGVAPFALLAGVLISLPAEHQDRRRSFYDSTRLAHAVDYLLRLAEELGRKGGHGRALPVSINVSLGTNGHAHDASSAVSRWIDHALATPGRSICVAAGNAGQEAPAEPGDWGYVLGRIHTSGRIAASGLIHDIEWIVAGDGIADLSENELEIWYAPQDRFKVQVKPPRGEWLPEVAPGEFIENRELDDGTFVSVYNERFAPANGANLISVYLSPFLSTAGVVGVGAGTWLVRLIGDDVRDGRFHGWIERDDPRRLGRVGMQEAWSFPSFFSRRSNVDRASVSSLACGHRVIAVANLDAAAERINITSSQGPTRDDRDKPDVAAPGTGVVAARGFDPTQQWMAMTGTSMASPYAAGVVAHMLAIDPALTAAQVMGILRRTAAPLPGTDFTWQDDAGFGRVRPDACVDEVRRLGQRRDLTA